jgi:hypothetical protein
MAKGEGTFGGVKIFNERSTDVYVQVQFVAQQGGAVVLHGDSGIVQLPGNYSREVMHAGAALHMPPATCAIVKVFENVNMTPLASFGPYGVQCRYGGETHAITGAEVFIGTDSSTTTPYCTLDVRLRYVEAEGGQPAKSVRFELHPGGYINEMLPGTTLGSFISTDDGMSRVGVDANDPLAKIVKQARFSTTLNDKWAFKVAGSAPTAFHLISLNHPSNFPEPAMTALNDAPAELIIDALPTPFSRLLLVRCFHDFGTGQQFHGWQIVCEETGRVLCVAPGDGVPLTFLAPNDPAALNQEWQISQS